MPKNFRFSKVNAGRVRKSNKFDLSHSLLGSMGFGDVIPTFCKLMIPQSSLKGNITSSIRVQPMPLPPFGKCGFHQYGQFVGITSLWRCFPEFIARKAYNGSNKSYIPSSVPYMPCMGKVSFFSQLTREKFCVWGAVKYSDTDPRGSSSASDSTGHSFKINSSFLSESDCSTSNLNTMCGFNGVSETRKDSANAPYTFVSNGFGKGNRVLSGDPNNPENIDRTDLINLVQHGVLLRPDVADFLMLFTKVDVKKASPSLHDKLFPASDTESSGIVVIGRWTNEGRNLVRILQGLGINISPSSIEPINLLPLFAFYKAWFDVFMPQRNIHWTDSQAFTLLNYCSENAKYVYDFAGTDKVGDKYVMGILADWFDSLGSLYATCDPNYFTSAVRNLNPSAQDEFALEEQLSDIDQVSNRVTVEAHALKGAAPQAVTYDGQETRSITRLQLQLVNTLAKYINTNTVIGQRLDAFFKAHFDGYTGKNDESTFAGASVTDIMLGDTIVTASTSDAKAGDFAGVGFGKGNYKMSYKAKEFGYFIVFGAVIPVSNYVQGTSYDSFLTHPLEFPHPEFDSLGYDYVLKGEILSPLVRDGRISIRPDSPFGYQPRYTGHKVMSSVVMGEPAFLSSRDQWLGFSLDNILSGGFTTIEEHADDHSASGYNGSNTYNLYNIPDSVLTAGTWWRYLGMYDWMGNYDRIFYDNNLAQGRKLSRALLGGGRASYAPVGTAPRSDGFILYQDHDVSYIAPLNSIGNSYDTIDGDNYVDHE